jgi:hypothetical protein
MNSVNKGSGAAGEGKKLLDQIRAMNGAKRNRHDLGRFSGRNRAGDNKGFPCAAALGMIRLRRDRAHPSMICTGRERTRPLVE